MPEHPQSESVYLPPHSAGRARRLCAADKRRWTEPPLVRCAMACGAVGQCKFQTPLAWPMRGIGKAKRVAARGLAGA